MTKRWWKLLAVLTVFALVVAACSGDTADDTEAPAETEAPAATEAPADDEPADDEEPMDDMVDLAGTSVTIAGPESTDAEAGGFIAAMEALSAETGIEITYAGSRDFSDNINAQVQGGNAPDIGIIPQPGKIADFAAEGYIMPLPDHVGAAVNEYWGAFTSFVTVDGALVAVPNKADLKSLVWYQPAQFAANGYDIPQSFDELVALTNEMIADGNTPWCVGIESGGATGWAFTDWVEDMTLRVEGPEYYDSWVAGETPFSDPAMQDIWTTILDLWNTPGAVFAAGGTIAATAFGANGDPLVAGDCLMHRQASFFSAFFPEGTPVADGSDGAVDVFYFPPVSDLKPVLGAGTAAVAFRDAPEVWAVMEYMATPEFANLRQAAQAEILGGGGVNSGFLSAAQGVDLSLWNDFEQNLISILLNADVFRFDGSDLMPAAVGAGSFWSEGTSAVNGDKSVADATAAIDATWP